MKLVDNGNSTAWDCCHFESFNKIENFMKTFAQKVRVSSPTDKLLFFNELSRVYVKKEFGKADVDIKKWSL